MIMNEIEKQVFNSISEEEQEKISGGDGSESDTPTTDPKKINDLPPTHSYWKKQTHDPLYMGFPTLEDERRAREIADQYFKRLLDSKKKPKK